MRFKHPLFDIVRPFSLMGSITQYEMCRHMYTRLFQTTTDINGGCTLEFQGTSSASPLAAGCVALTLEAK